MNHFIRYSSTESGSDKGYRPRLSLAYPVAGRRGGERGGPRHRKLLSAIVTCPDPAQGIPGPGHRRGRPLRVSSHGLPRDGALALVLRCWSAPGAAAARWRQSYCWACRICLNGRALTVAAGSFGEAFASKKGVAQALMQAMRGGDNDTILKILRPGSKAIVSSGDFGSQ